jgi:hypothetical protein
MVCEHWQSQVERMINEEAVKLVKDSYGERLDKVNEMLEDVARHIMDKFGLKDEED